MGSEPKEEDIFTQSLVCPDQDDEKEEQTATLETEAVEPVQTQIKDQATADVRELDTVWLQIHTVSLLMPDQVDHQYTCDTCASRLKDTHAALQHIKSYGHLFRLQEYYISVLLSKIPSPVASQLQAMTDVVLATYRRHSAVEQAQVAVRENIVQVLNQQVKLVSPDITLQLFGSSVTGFGLTTSDVNINLILTASSIDMSQAKIPGLLLKILEFLRNQSDMYYDVKDDFYSPLKVPRILFRHKFSNLLCELRTGSIAPITLSSLLSLYCSMDPRVSKLCVFIRHIAKVLMIDRQIEGHFPSVIYILLVIHYLQHTKPPVLPVLHEMVQTESSLSAEADPSISQLMAAGKEWTSDNTQSLGALLHGLLKYYVVKFPIYKQAVSIRQYQPLLRRERGWGSKRLAIEDPVIPKSNIARGSGSDKVFEYFQSSLKLLLLHLLQINQKLSMMTQDVPSPDIIQLYLSITESQKPHPAKDETDCLIDLEQSMADEETGRDEESEEEHILTGEEDITDEGGKEGITDEGKGKTDEEKRIDERKEATDEGKEEADKRTDEEKGKLPYEKEDRKSQEDVNKSGNKKSRKAQDMKILQQMLVQLKIEEDKAHIEQWTQLESFQNLLKTYPVACILCKKARHSALKCPDDNVPKLQREIPLPLVKYLKLIDMILVGYMNEVMLLPREEKDRLAVRDMILSDIRKLYPKASLELFGSSANGFGNCQSDLDLCLIMNETYECDKSEIIENLAKSVRKNSNYSHILPILSARVPIVKMYVHRWNVEADISLENGLALQNTRMLAAYHKIDDRVRPLGYAIKYFAKACDMCDASSGSISSYAYIIMLIHYLQQLRVPVLPVLQKLPYNGANTGPIIDEWNCYFFNPRNLQELYDTWKPVAKNTMSISQLWIGFLRYYAKDFDWAHHVVTMRQLEPLSKFEKWWSSKAMTIEDPFNLDHNLGQAVSNRMRTYILMRFQKAYYYHCKPKMWRNIEDLMDEKILCGDFRPPKFIICDKCGHRGHRALYCTKDATEKPSLSEEQKPPEKDVKKKQQSETKSTTSSEVKESDSTHTNDLSRSQIRSSILEQTGGSVDDIRKMKQQLRSKVYSQRGTQHDRKTLSVLNEILRKPPTANELKESTNTKATPTVKVATETKSRKKVAPKADSPSVKTATRSNPIAVPVKQERPLSSSLERQTPLLPSPFQIQSPTHYTHVATPTTPPSLLPTPPLYNRVSPPVIPSGTPPTPMYAPSQYSYPVSFVPSVPHSAIPYVNMPAAPGFNYVHGYHGNTPPQASPPTNSPLQSSMGAYWGYPAPTYQRFPSSATPTHPRYPPPNQP